MNLWKKWKKKIIKVALVLHVHVLARNLVKARNHIRALIHVLAHARVQVIVKVVVVNLLIHLKLRK